MYHVSFNPKNIYQELRSRPSPHIADRANLFHLATLCSGQSGEERVHLKHLFVLFSIEPIVFERCLYHDFGTFELRYEKHQEFSTYTVIFSAEDSEALVDLWRWLADAPGQHFVKTDCVCLRMHDPLSLSDLFEGQRVCASRVAGGAAAVYTSFGLLANASSRFVIINDFLNNYQLGRLTQRLLEIEAYRILALVTLPLARSLLESLSKAELNLAKINERLSRGNSEQLANLLDRLLTMSARLHAVGAKANSRIEASKAYYQLVLQRLDQLREEALPEHQSLSEFLGRRLTPGVNTCRTSGLRMNSVQLRVAQTANLVAAKVNVQQSEQQKVLLAAMNRRSRVQLHVQLALESLSVAAIAYYFMGLLHYVIVALPILSSPQHQKAAMAVSVPLVLLLI